MKRNLRFWLLLAMMLSIHISLYAADDTSPKKTKSRNEIEKCPRNKMNVNKMNKIYSQVIFVTRAFFSLYRA